MRILAALLAAAIGLGAASLAGGATTRARVVVKPDFVRAGGTIKVVGHGFRPRGLVRIGMYRRGVGVVTRLGSLRAGATGGFTLTKTLKRTTGAGRWVVRACQRQCGVKATAEIRIAKVKPL